MVTHVNKGYAILSTRYFTIATNATRQANSTTLANTPLQYPSWAVLECLGAVRARIPRPSWCCWSANFRLCSSNFCLISWTNNQTMISNSYVHCEKALCSVTPREAWGTKITYPWRGVALFWGFYGKLMWSYNSPRAYLFTRRAASFWGLSLLNQECCCPCNQLWQACTWPGTWQLCRAPESKKY